ncbi:site-2 protease family protein [Anaerobranca gottschalkii]|uniref:Peptidase family M50 n=1 Tax=Anaerobranca gottschalkii DSM 13577 TaxID=1120990 RepID=A0A1I0C4G9_9FIRM|nr:site-2 protease family protein [Anaerobranca gottschalkii]SET14396.1 Peptidase family M50 [Anaerobranca gottschalkii DSM 13577]
MHIIILIILEVLFNILIVSILVWLSFFIAVFLHEMGHALMYRIFFRDKDWHIRIGSGREIIKSKKFTIKAIPIDGYFYFEPKHRGSKFQYIMMLLGGPLTNILFIFLLSFLLYILKGNEQTLVQKILVWLFEFSLRIHVVGFLLTAIPINFRNGPLKGYTSDGMNILKIAMKSKKG